MPILQKKLIVATAALAMLIGPALAQSGSRVQEQTSDPSKRGGPVTTGQAAPTPPAVRGPNDVYCGGEYLGSDPDPKVRAQLLREAGQKDCN
jgi:hypothetical protein